MRVIVCRNVNSALPLGLRLLQNHGITRDSRNGPVVVASEPVTTVYHRPQERVLFWPQRDANPAFHLYESLWMLAGRNDLAPLLRYVKDFGRFSDDGVTVAGAYGQRWRSAFGLDQLAIIADRLRKNADDRRCVLQMWDPTDDLGGDGKDYPCNLSAALQRNAQGDLDLCLFQRSGDVIWGVYGANAVHFSFLQEYLAAWIGCAAGTFTHATVNYHAYVPQFEELKELPRLALDRGVFSVPAKMACPYEKGEVVPLALISTVDDYWEPTPEARVRSLDSQIMAVLDATDYQFTSPAPTLAPFFAHAYAVLRAHHLWRTLTAPERFERALEVLAHRELNQQCDWIVAMRQWLQRRQARWEAKMAGDKTAVEAV